MLRLSCPLGNRKGGNNMNISELNVELVRKGLTIPKLAEKIGIGKKALYQKFKGITQFTLPEIRSICSVLNIQGERILEIFFNDKVA